MSPRWITICATCRVHYSASDHERDNLDAAAPCISAGHDVYESGWARLSLPTLRSYRRAEDRLTLF